MHAMEILDGMLRDLGWLQESATVRRRTWSLWSRQPAAVRPLFSEVVIEWDEATSESSAELVGC